MSCELCVSQPVTRNPQPATQMLSILIPIYNFDIVPLVRVLHEQCMASRVVFEILCFDDGSKLKHKEMNWELQQITHVKYVELPQNVGRSAIRNLLGKAAQYDYLLFMDCDSYVNEIDYIKNYLDRLNPKALLYGGRSYDPLPPLDDAFHFHWWCGIRREQTTAAQRSKKPWHSFMTNNFLVPRAIFLDILFDENLKQYGHEDTLFGLELKQRNIPIIHIDNPLEHVGLEPIDTFIAKNVKAIANLYYLSQQYPFVETRLLKLYKTCEKWGLRKPILYFYRKYQTRILRYLRNKKPSLFYFDFYKLGEICRISLSEA